MFENMLVKVPFSLTVASFDVQVSRLCNNIPTLTSIFTMSNHNHLALTCVVCLLYTPDYANDLVEQTCCNNDVVLAMPHSRKFFKPVAPLLHPI